MGFPFAPLHGCSRELLVAVAIFFHCSLVFHVHLTLVQASSSPPLPLAAETPLRFLLRLKNLLDDPAGFLSDWSNTSTTSPCTWTGVVCSSPTSTHANDPVDVVGLNLFNLGLQGSTLPSDICKGLPNLTHIDFSFNQLQGPFPPALLQCNRLQHLNLSSNLYVGSLPSAIDQLEALQVLDLSYNNFSGSIPEAFGRLPQLLELNLYANLLNTTIPPYLGQLSKLQYLRLAYNPFLPASIPPELGNLTELTYLWLTGCNLIGTVPSTLGNLFKISNLDLSGNGLTGTIPLTLFNLENLYQLELYGNQLEGSIPDNIGSLSSIVNLDLSDNKLSGPLPSTIARLHKLQSLHINNNALSGSLPEGIADLPALAELCLFNNSFSGYVPQNLGRASKLAVFDVSSNNFTGSLPPNLCAGGALQVLITMYNSFNGTIPETYGDCTHVQRLRMNGNMLTGTVPEGFWGLPAIYILELENNYLEGSISSSIGNAANLSTLRLANNQFSGSLPGEIGNLGNLTVLSLPQNQLSGSLPKQLGSLQHLNTLYLQFNLFSGQIPQEISLCKQLNTLNLAHNRLSDAIPDSLGNFPSINTIDLSYNRLTGKIPTSLFVLKVTSFNVSYNLLSGEVPSGSLGQAFDTSFVGNQGLCGEHLLGVKECKRPSKLLEAMLAGIFATAFMLLMVGLATLYKLHRPFPNSGYKFQRSSWSLTSFHKVGFSENDILSSLDEDNVIGSGGAGKVYKTTLRNGETVAIKKLWSASGKYIQDVQEEDDEALVHEQGRSYNVDRGFRAEVATLGKIRHKNIVKLLCCCSSKDTKLLVYEYMPNGSLGDLLHGRRSAATCCKAGFVLDWPSRHKIALGAAQGLAYLHHDCSPPIVHRDVKSNNILLDADLNAHVADFGVAKIMPYQAHSITTSGHDDHAPPPLSAAAAARLVSSAAKTHVDQSLLQSSCIAGSYGYIAPEHAYTPKVTEKSDIYSFGVVLLELVTGKKPVAPEVFGDNTDIVKWVCNKLSNHDGVKETLDSRIADCSKEEMMLVLRVALLCTSAMPSNRPAMREVVDMLVQADPRKLKWKAKK